MKTQRRLLQGTLSVFAICLFLWVLVPTSYAAAIQVNANDPDCIPLGTGPAYCSIQGAIDAASPGDIINVAAGIYSEQLVLMKDNVTIDGASEATTIINGMGASGYHFHIRANGVTVRDFTLLGNSAPPGSYGLKIEGDLGTSTQYVGVTVENVTVNASYRTGVDLNGIDGATLTNVTVKNVPYGNGIATTDVDNATLTNITTMNNAWGGVAIYTKGQWIPSGPSDNIDVDNLIASEPNPLYWELGCVGSGCTPFDITNFTAPQFTHVVRNDTYRAGGENFTHFQYAEADAIDFALALTNPQDSTINEFDGALGIFGFFVVGTNSSGEMRIQTAIDKAAAGDTVEVREGNYEESLYVDKEITLVGDSVNAVVEAPLSVPTCFATSSDKHPVICIEDTSDVIIDSLTIDGLDRGNGNYQFIGVAFHNAGGTLQNSVLKGIRDTPFNGSQHGVAIYSYNGDTTGRAINVRNNQIYSFQKNAIALNADATTPLVVDVSGNTLSGAGPTTVTAQNGIQVWGEQITGLIANNIISGIAYDNTNSPTKWVASSILNLYANIDIIANTVLGGHVGVYNIDGSGLLADNNLTIDKVGVSAYGIVATDPPDVVPSPFGAASSGLAPNNRHGTETVTHDVEVASNFVLFHGPDNSGANGIEGDAGYGPDDIDITITSNVVRGFEVGVELYECEGGCDPGVFVAVAVVDNCIEANSIGLRSNLTIPAGNPVPAENNWWGAADGPGPTGSGNWVVGNVDYAPFLPASNCADLTPGNWQNLTTGAFYATLQDAVNNAATGDEIMATDRGSYAGAIVSTPGVTINLNGAKLNGASPGVTISSANVTLMNGLLDGLGSSDPGVLITAGGDNLILTNMEVTGWQDGVRLQDAAPFTITSFKVVNSYIHDNANAGLQVGANANLNGVVTVMGNLFKANGTYGIENLSGLDINASYNSWGCFDGPGSSGCDTASANVVFTPWTFSELYLDVAPPLDAPVVDVFEGETFDVELKIDTVNLNGLAFDFTYDSNMLTLNSTSFVTPWAGSCDPVGALAIGRVYYSCSLVPPPSASGYTQAGSVVATFSFTAQNNGGLVDPGPWTTHFDINTLTTASGSIGGAKIFVNNAGYGASNRPPIDDSQDGQVNIIPTGNFSGFIDLQGRSNDTGGTVTVYNGSIVGSSTALAAGTSNSAGSYTTSGIAGAFLPLGQTFWLYADAPLYLPTTADVDLVYVHSGVLTLRPATPLNLLLLLGGDATDDNFINVLDATCIGTDFGSSSSTCSTGDSDVNADGTINILDLTLMGGNWQHAFSDWIPQ